VKGKNFCFIFIFSIPIVKLYVTRLSGILMLPSPPPSTDGPRERARILIDRKQSIEAEITEQMSVLASNGCDMHTPLVDGDGFPRADIDIWAVRTARVRIIELRNDLSAVVDAIAKALEGVFNPDLADPTSSAETDELKPFARVDVVSHGGPASQAGLQREDLIVKFGHLTSKTMSSSSMQPVAELVSANEDRHIIIKVLRSDRLVYLTLIPKQGWGGRGLLGCHIVPYSPS